MEGYNELAALMATYPVLAIFRRFLLLNVRDLLIIQGELTHLEAEYKDVVLEDCGSGDPQRINLQYDIGALEESAEDPERKHQWELTLKIRAKLKEHYEILLRVSSMLRLHPANSLDFRTLRIHLARCRDKNSIFLRGYEAETWNHQHEGDLTSLTDRYRNKDVLSKLIDQHCIPWYDRVRGSKVRDSVSLAEVLGSRETPDLRLWNYSDTTVSLVVSTIGIALAPLLPMTAILALYFVERQLTKILLTMLFTLLFSLALTLLTRARPVDRFIATAAFAAVLVVFVQPNDCGACKTD